MRYLRTFAITAPLGVLFAHFIPETPMPWYPDACIFGGFMGAMVAFIVMNVTHAGCASRHLRGAGKAGWNALRGKRS